MENILKNNLIVKALEVAAKAHDKQYRKGSNIPYIVHPYEVGLILQYSGADIEMICAGILHDTLEDTVITKEDIKNIFGERVLNLVIGASEKLDNRENTCWKSRKQHTINKLKTAEKDVKLLSCADKLCNIKSMVRDYETLKDELWNKFTTNDKNEHIWYYTSLVDSLSELSGEEIYEEFKRIVSDFKEVVTK